MILLSKTATIQIKTIETLLENCKSFAELKQIHALLTTLGLSLTYPFSSKLLFSTASYSNIIGLEYSRRIFRQLENPSIYNYNAIVRGYSNTKHANNSLLIFVRMLRDGVVSDHMTYPFVVKAAAKIAELKLGKSVHGVVLRNGYVSDKFVSNSLIHMYGACKDVGSARKVFDEMVVKNSVSWNAMLDGYGKCGEVIMMRQLFDAMPERDVISWSSLIDGYVKAGEYAEALGFFDRMRIVGPMANEVTMVSVLCACAHLGALEQGRMIHRYVVENGLPYTLVLRTSLVDMYAKCGAIEEALSVFRGVSKRTSDVLIWNAMIGGLATHGFTMESLDLYREMQSLEIRPDEITYLCLLSACAHGGLVKEAWHFFECLTRDGMTPKSEHYACMVDVLSRAGQLIEAYKFVCQMPMEPTASVLGALLSGCMNHRNFDLAETVGKKLIELDPNHDGRYIGLSNVYALVKRWEEARTMREAMETRGVKKSAGFSIVEILGVLHRFIAHDKVHPKSEQIYWMLNIVVEEIKMDAEVEAWKCCLLN